MIGWACRILAHRCAQAIIPVLAHRLSASTTSSSAVMSSPPPKRATLAVGAGRANADIARELHMSVPTVKAHVSRLLAELEVENRIQIALLVHHATDAR